MEKFKVLIADDNREFAQIVARFIQEEEEFIANHLNRIFDAFLASHVEGYKN